MNFEQESDETFEAAAEQQQHAEERARLAYEEYSTRAFSLAAVAQRHNLSVAFFKSWLIANGKPIFKGRPINPNKQKYRPRMEYRINLLIKDFGVDAIREYLNRVAACEE